MTRPSRDDFDADSLLTVGSVSDVLAAPGGAAQVSGKGRSEMRSRILDAAIELAAARRFESVGMRQLATRVGLSASGLYSHFDSKESIFAAAMQQAMGRFLRAVVSPIDSECEADRLSGVIRRHVEFQLENLPLARANDRLMERDVMRRFLNSADYDILRAAQRSYYDVLRELLEKRVPQASNEHVTLTAFAVLAMCERVTTWYSPNKSLSPRQVADHYARLAENIVAGLEGAA